MVLIFSSLVALQLVGMTTADVANGGIVGIMTFFGFQWFFQDESCNKLEHGRISPKYSQDIPHSPPVRSRYGDILCEFTPCHLAFVIAVSNVISCYTVSCFIHYAYFLRWEDSEPDRTDPWRPSQCYKRGGTWLLLISLFPGLLASNLKCTSFTDRCIEHFIWNCSQLNVTQPNYYVNTGSDNSLVPPGNRHYLN